MGTTTSVADQAERDEEVPVRSLHGREFGDLQLTGEVRVLIVDDDATICRLIKTALTGDGILIDVVSDPAKVEAQVRGKSYHVIILDYVIPGLVSEKTLEWINEHQPEAGIIVITGYPSLDSALNCLRAHIFDYITKPFQVAQLQRVVMRCLEIKGWLRMTEELLREALGLAIRERRKSLKLTLAQLAQRANVSLGYLSQIELGRNSASVDTLYRIALALESKLSDLFEAIEARGL